MNPLFRISMLLVLLASTPTRAADPVVVVETSLGSFKVELNEAKAPVTVKNFLTYVDEKFYDNTLFHRVMSKENWRRDFMIQGGGIGVDKKEKETRAPIKNEAANGLSNARNTIAMARTSDPNSAAAQFFINLADNVSLDRANDPDGAGFCVFGKVIEGLDVVEKIKAVKTGDAELEIVGPSGKRVKLLNQNVPVENVVIKSIKRIGM